MAVEVATVPERQQNIDKTGANKAIYLLAGDATASVYS
jgi:hypothetical protein